MTKLRRRITVEELRPIVKDYHRAFFDWRFLEGELLARENGPVMQVIGFERLSTGSYRPVCGLHYLCIPNRDGQFGHQFLNVKVRQVHPRAHESIRDNVIEAIHREIVPSVDAPLDPEQVLQMHESYEFIRSPDAYSLAALNAYLGHNERALYWCYRFSELVNESPNPWQDFDIKRQAFLEQVKTWIESGTAKRELERVMQEERHRWGLV